MRNEILLTRIARLIALNYALSEESTIKRLMELNSIDALIQELQQPTVNYKEQ